MTIADMDVERLRLQRQKISTFAAVAPDGTPSSEYRRLYSIVRLGRNAETDFAENSTEASKHILSFQAGIPRKRNADAGKSFRYR